MNTLAVFGLVALSILGLITAGPVIMAWVEDRMVNDLPGHSRGPGRESAQPEAVPARPVRRRRPRFLAIYQVQHAVVPGRRMVKTRRAPVAQRQTCSQ